MTAACRISLFTAMLAALILSTGCKATRMTTTDRTAVEQALLSKSVEATILSNEIPAGHGTSFQIHKEEYTAADKNLVASRLRAALLKSGYADAATMEGKSDLTIFPNVDFSAIDDSAFFVGVPSIPIPVPPLGAIQTPELALVKKDDQWGRSRIGVTAIETETGELAFSTIARPAEEKYVRWTLLLVFGFRQTSLDEPF